MSEVISPDLGHGKEALEMSLADFIAPLLHEGEHLSKLEVEVQVWYKDGSMRTVKLDASLVEWRVRMRA